MNLNRLSTQQRDQLWRAVRLAGIVLGSSAVVANLVNSWEARWPLLAVLIPLLEIAYKVKFPSASTKTAAHAAHAAKAAPPGP